MRFGLIGERSISAVKIDFAAARRDVIIQADGKATNELLIAVMDACREAGVLNVSIAAELT